MPQNQTKAKYMSSAGRTSRIPTSYMPDYTAIDLLYTYKYQGIYLQP